MNLKCSNQDCPAPPHCHEGEEDYNQCKFWLDNNTETKNKIEQIQTQFKISDLSWTGESYKVEDIFQISRRTSTNLIGIVGKANAGKTTFLAMLYTLLLNGKKFKHYKFAGTKTILGWDELYNKLKIQMNSVAFPDPTPSQYYRLLHFALRDSEGRLKDILLSDSSGEVFSVWSQNKKDENAEIARWVYSNSNGFILFIDCEDLIVRKNAAKTEILDMAQMLNSDLCNRPVIAVWSKSDKIEAINSIIKNSLQEELKQIFLNYKEIQISNFSKDDPDVLVHDNNIETIDWLLDQISKSSIQGLIVDNTYKGDVFLGYKGK
ncbi:50S ribosome-binding GTPase [Leptospira phage vb_LkmZ_Bejolso9-LE1]|nr:50S ribosome-binding GTPase [Leptospira phage vb_LkmZ_Bejolso9-LE1]